MPAIDLQRHLLRGEALFRYAVAKVAIDNASFDPTFCDELFNKCGCRKYLRCLHPPGVAQPLKQLPLVIVGNVGTIMRHHTLAPPVPAPARSDFAASRGGMTMLDRGLSLQFSREFSLWAKTEH
jgi:hypothetical protein